MWQFKWMSIVICCVALVACTKKTPNSPTGVLEEYIRIAMNAKSVADKDKMMEHTMGPALDDLQNMTAEKFEEQFIKSNLKFTSFTTKDLREENSGDVSVVYELNYQQSVVTGDSTEMSNKKIAFLGKNENGVWKIKETKNVKSFVDKKDALEVLGAPLSTETAKDKP
jgi:hypothetical protein